MEGSSHHTDAIAASTNQRGTRSDNHPDAGPVDPRPRPKPGRGRGRGRGGGRGAGGGQQGTGGDQSSGPSRPRGRGRGDQSARRTQRDGQKPEQQPGDRPEPKPRPGQRDDDPEPQTDRPKKPTGRRGAKFQGSLAPDAGVPDPNAAASNVNPAESIRAFRRQPDPDTLAGRLAHALQTPPYADCPICFNAIHPAQPTWSCAPPTLPRADQTDDRPDDDSDGDGKDDCCWTTFHLKCIKSWASKSVHDLEAAWRARGEERQGEWRCPGCQARRTAVPTDYTCFCGQTVSPAPPPRRSATPHSCAAQCARPRRLCTHACPLACHPGPCPPCTITVRQRCWCGKEERAWRCSEVARSSRVSGPGVQQSGVSCARVCGRPLGCGNPEHRCTQVCHPGPCTTCEAEEDVRCFCGKHTKRVRCGQDRERAVQCAAGKESWEGRFECDGVCARPFACGTHTCSRSCHPPSSTPPPCPFDPASMTTCPCGRVPLKSGNERSLVVSSTPNDPVDADPSLPPVHTHPQPGALPRISCTAPVPTCLSLCARPHPACGHPCEARCHAGPCPPCGVRLRRACRCGSAVREVVCGEEGEGKEWTCARVCHGMLSCRRHACARVCCPLAALAGGAAGKRRAPGAAEYLLEESGEAGGLHACQAVCGRLLSCGNHTCERRDHLGPCGGCLRSEFSEMICPCGRTIVDPPIPCGTRLECKHACDRPPPCGHSSVPHACHAASRVRAATGQEEWIVAGVGVPWTDGDDTQGVQQEDDGEAAEDEGEGEGAASREPEWRPSACPPCVVLVRKRCACGKKEVDYVPCSRDRSRVSCGTVCGRLLGCGYHTCPTTCHSPPCGPCTAPCGKPRRSCLPAHHPCTAPCHAPASCPEDEPCLAPVTLTCACGRMRSIVPCMRAGPSSSSPTTATGGGDPDVREGALKCTPECAAAKRRAQLADALGIAPAKRGPPPPLGQGRAVTYADELLTAARREGARFVALVEKTLGEFVAESEGEGGAGEGGGKRKTRVLPHMPPERRALVHALAGVYRLDASMVDAEPHRSVMLARRIDSRVPVPLLSQVAFGTASAADAAGEKDGNAGKGLGKLADLRGGKIKPLAYGVSAPESTPSPAAGAKKSAWTSVVARPASGTSTPPVATSGWASPATPRSGSPAPAAGAVGISGRAGASVTGPPSRQRTPAPAPVVPTPPPAQAVPAEDVPDDWEDDA